MIRYDQQIVGTYVTDLLVEGKVLVELKAVSGLERAHRMQCVHYLKATGLRIGLLLNLGRGHLRFQDLRAPQPLRHFFGGLKASLRKKPLRSASFSTT